MQGAPKVLQNLLFQISFEIPDLIFELVFFLNFELNVAEGFMGFDYGLIRYFWIDVIPIKIVALVIVKDITIWTRNFMIKECFLLFGVDAEDP